MRITHKDTEAMFDSTKAAALLAGVDSSKWVLYKGESFYRLVTIDAGTEGHRSVVSYLGNTAAQTHAALSFMREAFHLVSQANA